jgi:hypothetical protein
MPSYTFVRREDGATTQRKLSFEEYDLIQSGAFQVVDDEGKPLELVFNPAGMAFVLKDGPSGGWVSKAQKENGYRATRGSVMARRQQDHVFKTRLIPNYQGQEADSWRDVREEARQRSGQLAASTYDQHVHEEKLIR